MSQFFLVKLSLTLTDTYITSHCHLMFIFLNALTHLMHTGSDYLVNLQNPSSRTFTVTFQSKQANSSENVIVVADDSMFEGTEAFRLRIVAARFIGQAAAIFRVTAGLTNTFADVIIEDDDCKFMNTTCIICLQTLIHPVFIYEQLRRQPVVIYLSCMHCFLLQL